ncbi:HEPN domain-containing protein [Frischella perrara]|uniref:ApeA N-terminal domain 1-containing protein n=1 Tax=Frischella perrara TaxID=1267021 RepID=UPI0023F2BDC1|nr:HEPN domain-containing protein [Frischella perrara]
MRIEENYIKHGYFWLPENKDIKLPGILSISDGGRAELEIIGSFGGKNGFNYDDMYDDMYLKRIIGLVEDDGLIILNKCCYIQKYIPSNENITKSKISSKQVFAGLESIDNEDITFNTFSFSVDCLDEWVNESAFKIDEDFKNGIINILYNLPAKQSLALDNGMKLDLDFSYSLPLFPVITEAKITQRTFFTLKSEEPCNIDLFISLAHKISHLISFAVGETVSIKNVSARKYKENDESVHLYSKKTKVFYCSTTYTKNIPKCLAWDMLFNFNTIKDNTEEVFNKWINAYENLSPTLFLYFSTKNNSINKIESKFLALAQALETYHRRLSDEKLMADDIYESLLSEIINSCPKEHKNWLYGRLKYGNEITLSKRLKKIIEPFKEYFGNNEQRQKLIKKIVDTRNFLTHYDKSLIDKSANSGRELYILYYKMEIILQLNFLQMIGFTSEDIKNIVKNCTVIKSKFESIKNLSR